MRLVESYRVVVFTPAHAVEPMLGAVRQIADLRYGDYAGVSWTSSGGEELSALQLTTDTLPSNRTLAREGQAGPNTLALGLVPPLFLVSYV